LLKQKITSMNKSVGFFYAELFLSQKFNERLRESSPEKFRPSQKHILK